MQRRATKRRSWWPFSGSPFLSHTSCCLHPDFWHTFTQSKNVDVTRRPLHGSAANTTAILKGRKKMPPFNRSKSGQGGKDNDTVGLNTKKVRKLKERREQVHRKMNVHIENTADDVKRSQLLTVVTLAGPRPLPLTAALAPPRPSPSSPPPSGSAVSSRPPSPAPASRTAPGPLSRPLPGSSEQERSPAPGRTEGPFCPLRPAACWAPEIGKRRKNSDLVNSLVRRRRDCPRLMKI